MNFLRSLTTGTVLLAASCSPSKSDLSEEIKNKVTAITSSGTPNSSGVVIVKRNGYTLQMFANGSWSIGHMPDSNPFSGNTVVSETIFDLNGDGIVDKKTSMQLGKTVELKEENLGNSPGAQEETLKFLEKMGNQTGEHPEKSENLPQVRTARWVKGAEGRMVFSPFTLDGLVDVTGMEPGTTVKCPMTGKIFTIPALPKPIPDHADAFLKKYQQ